MKRPVTNERQLCFVFMVTADEPSVGDTVRVDVDDVVDETCVDYDAVAFRVLEQAYNDLDSSDSLVAEKARKWFASPEEDYIFSFRFIANYFREKITRENAAVFIPSFGEVQVSNIGI